MASTSLLTYPGSKRRNVRELFEHIPQGTKTVVSLFFGGGSFELYLAHRGIRVIACDVFVELVNFWNQVRMHRHRVADLVQKLHPVTPRGFKEMFALLERGGTGNAAQDAAVFYVLNQCSFGGKSQKISMDHTRSFNNKIDARVQRIKAFVWPKLLTLQLCDYRKLLAAHPKAFVFADPPYLMRRNEMYGLKSEHHKNFDHVEFSRQIHRHRGQWLITYNKHPLVLELFADDNIQEMRDTHGFIRNKELPGQILIQPA